MIQGIEDEAPGAGTEWGVKRGEGREVTTLYLDLP